MRSMNTHGLVGELVYDRTAASAPSLRDRLLSTKQVVRWTSTEVLYVALEIEPERWLRNR